ncbi:MAG: response regulator [Oscillospiraceae bacterium]|nr:response regulator [Oscillospiraceae bacterium]
MDDKKIILAVDDMPTNLQILQSLLSDEFSVRLAKSGHMALSALTRIRADLILLDIEMPGLSGFDVMNELQKNPDTRDIPVIFVTAHATREVIARAAKAGAKDYLVKPFDPQALREKIWRVLGANLA